MSCLYKYVVAERSADARLRRGCHVHNHRRIRHLHHENNRFEELTGKIQTLNFKVETLTVQVQRMAEALKLELPHTSGERESDPSPR